MPFEEKEFSELIAKFKQVRESEKIKTDMGFKDRLRGELMAHADKIVNKPSFWEQWRIFLIAAPSVLGVALIAFALVRTDFLFKPVALEGDKLEINVDSSTLPFDEDSKVYMPGVDEDKLGIESAEALRENAALYGNGGSDAATAKSGANENGLESPDLATTPVPKSVVTPRPIVSPVPLPTTTPALPTPAINIIPQDTLIMPGVYTNPVGAVICNLSVIYDSSILIDKKGDVKAKIVMPLLNTLKDVKKVTVSNVDGKYRTIIEWCNGEVEVKYY